ncbi:MAG TPA: hypothetical protein VJS69_01500 [Candidatus Krumholzibacteria bacterium]|nr:hypothetical protein [Candidatus Krumholzibacteria bacterium]
MTKQKDLKRLVRSRMQKTGESYTTARKQLTKKKTAKAASKTASKSTAKSKSALKSDFARLGGMSDEIVAEKTGRTWQEWVELLDRARATTMTHTAIATLLHEKHDVPGWWCQMVAVGYERIRGLRARGQRRDGKWEASKSKTFAVPVAELFEAWNVAKTRAKWLPGKVTVRRATPHKSMRLTMPDGSNVELYFLTKGGKSVVGVQHTKLASKADADERKKFWAERLAALNELLAD